MITPGTGGTTACSRNFGWWKSKRNLEYCDGEMWTNQMMNDGDPVAYMGDLTEIVGRWNFVLADQ